MTENVAYQNPVRERKTSTIIITTLLGLAALPFLAVAATTAALLDICYAAGKEIRRDLRW